MLIEKRITNPEKLKSGGKIHWQGPWWRARPVRNHVGVGERKQKSQHYCCYSCHMCLCLSTLLFWMRR